MLGHGSLASRDESLYAVVAREVAESGKWLRLTFGGSLWFDKPPLAIWATALTYQMFGVSEFTARFISAISGFGTVILTYFLGRKLFNRWTAFCGALILLSSSHFLRFSRFGMLDSPFTFFLVLSLFLFWLGQTHNRYLVFSGLAIGAAIMTKGFAGILIFPIIWIYCWASDRLEILGRSSYWIGVILAVFVALPWNIYELVAHNEFFMRGVVLKHLVLRTTGAIEGHAGNVYFYIRVLVNKYHPWILIGIFSAPYFLWKAWRSREDEKVFLATWMFFFFAVITVVRTKLPWYIFPVYPALSLSVAYFLVKVFSEKYSVFVKLMFLTIMVLHGMYSHLYEMDYSRPIKALAPIISASTPKEAKIYFYKYHEQPAAMFYLRRTIAYLETPEEVGTALNRGDLYLLAKEEDLMSLRDTFKRSKVKAVGSAHGYFFLQSSN